VGFWDGFTQPVFGGTAALRSLLGANGGLNTCSAQYQAAHTIGRVDMSLELGALGGAFAETRLDALLTGLPRLGPVISPLGGGVAGAYAQALARGQTPTPSTAAEGAAGGLFGELATGFFSGRSAQGAAGAIGAAYSALNY
jgi:hypothetical protein